LYYTPLLCSCEDHLAGGRFFSRGRSLLDFPERHRAPGVLCTYGSFFLGLLRTNRKHKTPNKMNTTTTMGDFLRLLAARLSQENIQLPLQNETLWHMLLFNLKRETPSDKFCFLQDLRFDWDGPYPRSREITEFIQALHWTGNTSAWNPSWERMDLSEDVAASWIKEFENLDIETKALADRAVGKAKIDFVGASSVA